MNRRIQQEKRCAPRESRNDTIWWASPLAQGAHPAWILETSRRGIAFLTRGRHTPILGMHIETLDQPPTKRGQRGKTAAVRRVNRVHADLFVVGAEYVNGSDKK
ncbi:MAG: hypothetical protein H6817_01670 [Phycisphaerales bacterium]|nr:hypothetical protein [Phycisphaerales bacterium]